MHVKNFIPPPQGHALNNYVAGGYKDINVCPY